MIRALVFDVDGVLTDGRSWVDDRGGESKQIRFRDLDALWAIHKQGYLLGFVTGEDARIVAEFQRRLPPAFLAQGCKNKLGALAEFARNAKLSAAEVCYVGDGESDAGALAWAG